MPDGGVIPSAPDLARLVDALLGGRLLSPPLLAAMMTPRGPPSSDVEQYRLRARARRRERGRDDHRPRRADPGVSVEVVHHLAAVTSIVVLATRTAAPGRR
jgi:hypothetical protein